MQRLELGALALAVALLAACGDKQDKQAAASPPPVASAPLSSATRSCCSARSPRCWAVQPLMTRSVDGDRSGLSRRAEPGG